MATNKKSSRDDTSIETPSTRPCRPSRTQVVQNFLLVWLDGSLDEIDNEDYRDSIKKLRQVVNTVTTFTNVAECVEYIDDIKDEKTFIISSGALGEKMVSAIHDKPQVNTIYIFCQNKARHEKWAQQWPKIKGVFTSITPICEALKQAVQDCDQNSVSISLVKKTDGVANQNLNELDQSFMYTQILKEILLKIDFEEENITEFLNYCYEQFDSNTTELENIKKLETKYCQHHPIWWYTYECFLYPMLNRALREMKVDLIIKMGFFVRDLHNHIAALHSEQYVGQNCSNSFIVYRAQSLPQKSFEELVKSEGGLLAFNNFLSTSKILNESLEFSRRNITTPDLVSVIFVMTIDPSTSSTPFADVCDVSAYPTEGEILFSMHSVFRIGQIKQMNGNDRIWQVDLTLTGDNDLQLQALTERMREETKGSTGWLRLGKLMVQLAQYDRAKDLYDTLFHQTIDEEEKGNILYQLGLISYYRGERENALKLYKDSLQIREKTLTSPHPDIADCHNDMGVMYRDMGEYSKALASLEQAHQIYLDILPKNHPDLANSYNNIGLVYNSKGEYSKALSYYEKDLEIRQIALPANHPSLATSFNNIGLTYRNMGEYLQALSYYEKAHQIYQKILPKNHPDLATSHNNIGWVYRNIGNYSKALSCYERALEIRERSLPPKHPYIEDVKESIEIVKEKI